MGQESKGVLIGSQTAESVFPALDIIRRAGPPEEFRDQLYDIIAWYLGSHIWHVREIAARTLCSFLLKPGWIKSVKKLLDSSGTSANRLHGALLVFKFLLERLVDVMPEQLEDYKTRHALADMLRSLPRTNSCLEKCPETDAVYTELVNFKTRLAPTGLALETGLLDEPEMPINPWAMDMASQPERSIAPSALLLMKLGDAAVHHAFRQINTIAYNTLEEVLITAVKDDINVACSMLEGMSSVVPLQSKEVQIRCVRAYVRICLETDAPEPRTIALENLATIMDGMLCGESGERLEHLPTNEAITQLWVDLRSKPMNPSLSDAIIRVSGPLLATILSRSQGAMQDGVEQWLRHWGVMISDAGMADRVSYNVPYYPIQSPTNSHTHLDIRHPHGSRQRHVLLHTQRPPSPSH